jgi:energy-coupling factor transporter ATP-binding protein EcfA2
MRIAFNNFGKAVKGDIYLNDLTIICGPNGSGKTYTSYAVFGCLNQLSELLDYGIRNEDYKRLMEGQTLTIDLVALKRSFDKIAIEAGGAFKGRLDRFFNAPDGFFDEASFSFIFDEDEFHIDQPFTGTTVVAKKEKFDFELDVENSSLNIKYTGAEGSKIPRQLVLRILSEMITNCLFRDSIPKPFVVTSERTGVSLFYKELDVNRNAILSQLSSTDKIDIMSILQAMQSKYAEPIQHNIDIVRDFGSVSKHKSFLKLDKVRYGYIFDALADLVGGTYRDENNQLVFSPRKERNKPKLNVPIYIASSSIKSLFLIDLYINYVAKKNGILIIDEPELNLHPDNQVKIAKFIARLVNSGVKVLVTTHSDYFVREINNLITLSSAGANLSKFKRKYKYITEDILKPENVSAYCAVPGEVLEEMAVSVTGIDTKIFDLIINEENYKAQDIYEGASQ